MREPGRCASAEEAGARRIQKQQSICNRACLRPASGYQPRSHPVPPLAILNLRSALNQNARAYVGFVIWDACVGLWGVRTYVRTYALMGDWCNIHGA